MRSKFMQVVVCAGALCLALAGCGNKAEEAAPSGGDQAPAEEQAVAPEPSDEELIKQDFTDRFESAFTVDYIKSLFEGDDETEEMFSAVGMTVDEYAELSKKLVLVEPTKVELDGDKATLTVEMTLPDWEAANEQSVLENLLEEKTEGVDPESLSEEETQKIFAEVMRESMSYPTMPSYVETFEVSYEKKDGTWAPVDSEMVTDLVDSVGEDM